MHLMLVIINFSFPIHNMQRKKLLFLCLCIQCACVCIHVFMFVYAPVGRTKADIGWLP